MNRPLREQLPAETAEPAELAPATVSEIASWLVGQPLDAVERELIEQTLQACGGDRVLAAGVLGLSLPQMRKKLTAYAVRGEAVEVAEPAPDVAQQRRRPRLGPPPPAANDARPVAMPEPKDVKAEAARAAAALDALEAYIRDTLEALPLEIAAPAAAGNSALLSIELETLGLDAVEIEAIEQNAEKLNEIELETLELDAIERDAIEAAAAKIEQPAPVASPEATRRTRLPLMPLLAGAAVAAMLAGGYFYFSGEETGGEPLPQAPMLQGSISERQQPFERMIPVPVWSVRPQPPEPYPMGVDIAADRRAPAPLERSNIEGDTRMTMAAPATPVRIAMPAGGLTKADIELDTRMDSVPAVYTANNEADTRMDVPPPPVPVAMPAGGLAGANIESDTRMDAPPALAATAGGETTGSIAPPKSDWFAAPKRVPMPQERLDPDARPEPRPVQRQAARPQPQPQLPQVELPKIPFLFPLNLFQPRDLNADKGN